MRALFIGTSGIGARHARNVRVLRPNAEMIAVRAEPNAVIDELSMVRVPSLEEGIARKPDFAVVALPPALHADVARMLIDARIDLYLEKPVATRVIDIEPVAVEAERNGVITMVGCNLRMTRGFAELRREIAGNVMGSVRHARLSVGQWLPDWRPGRDYRSVFSSQRALGGGVMLELIHEIDLARFLFGDFDQVHAMAGNSGALDIDVEDHADILLGNDHMNINLHLDCLDREGYRQGRITCANGSYAYDTTKKELARFSAYDRSWTRLGGMDPFSAADALRAAMAHFIDCVEARAATNQPLMEGVHALKLATAARAAAGIV